MKTEIKKTLAICLITLMPFALLADDDDHHEHQRGYVKAQDAFIQKHNIDFIYEGNVESKPKSGYNGIWRVSGVDFIVDNKSIVHIEKDDSYFSQKLEAKVYAKREEGQMRAIKIEIEND